MGISERKERDKQEMRKNIISAAMHMFTHEGYENASIRKIADKIEYSPATIYLYYKDKDELLYDVQAECFGKLVEVFQKEATAENPFERLEQIGRAYLNFGHKNPEVYELMFITKAPMNSMAESEPWKNGDDAFAFLATCIHQCIEQGLVRYTSVLQGALSVWAMAHGLISLDVCCRMKVMNQTGAEVTESINTAMAAYLSLIKA